MRIHYNIQLSYYHFSYLHDMGPLRQRTFQNKGFRDEPELASRITDYRNHLHREGVIIHGEKIVVGLRGGGLALVTVLPEVIERACQRNGKKFKRGDVTVVVDVLKEVREEPMMESLIPSGYMDYVRSSKQLQRTMLLSDIILPAIVEGVARSDLLHCDILDPSDRRNGLDVYRMSKNDVEMISEREKELFSSITD